MPTIKYVDADGGVGIDYTTLATWEDFADGEATADQWAECTGTNDLGNVFLANWTATPTTSVFPKIYAASGHEVTNFSNGVLTGAITNSTGKLELVGLRWNLTGLLTAPHMTYMHECIGERTDGPGLTWSVSSAVPTADTVIENCIFKGSTYGAQFSSKHGTEVNVSVTNCLFIGGSVCGVDVGRAQAGATAYTNFNLTIKNCCSLKGSGAAWIDSGANVHTIVDPSNNAGDDGTATSLLGGTGNQDNITIANEFTDSGSNDYTLLPTGVLHRGGVATSNSDSLSGMARNQYSNPDIGPYEIENTTSRRMLITGVA